MVEPSSSSYDEVDFVLKVVVCGEETAGKTSLSRRFAQEGFNIQEAPTLGVGLYIRCIPATKSGRIFKLQVWDTSGKARFQMVSGGWYQGASVYVFVYDTCSRRSFDRLNHWLEQSGWSKRDHSKVVGLLVATHTDCVTYREVEEESGKDYADAHSLHFYETSALTGDGVQEVFQCAVDRMDEVCREMTQQEVSSLLSSELTAAAEDSVTITLISSGKKSKCCCVIL